MNRKEFAALVEIDPRQLIDIEKKPVPYSRDATLAGLAKALDMDPIHPLAKW